MNLVFHISVDGSETELTLHKRFLIQQVTDNIIDYNFSFRQAEETLDKL